MAAATRRWRREAAPDPSVVVLQLPRGPTGPASGRPGQAGHGGQGGHRGRAHRVVGTGGRRVSALRRVSAEDHAPDSGVHPRAFRRELTPAGPATRGAGGPGGGRPPPPLGPPLPDVLLVPEIFPPPF